MSEGFFSNGFSPIPGKPLHLFSGWQVGDRVLAPWKPQYLYAGSIQEIKGSEAHIAFDDGDCGWVLLPDLQRLEIRVGQEVSCRLRMGPLFAQGVVAEVRGETIRVVFSHQEEWTTVAALRIPASAPTPGAQPTAFASHLAFARNLKQGERVLAPWEAVFLYAGTVMQIQGDEVHVDFDDGDAGWVKL